MSETMSFEITMENGLNEPNDSFDNLSSSDLSFNTSIQNTKKIKLSQKERDKIKLEKERLKKEREILKIQRETAKLEREKARIEREKLKVAQKNQLLEERRKKQNDKQMKIQLKKEEQMKREQIKKEKEEERLRLREAKEKEKQQRLEEKHRAMEEAVKQKEMKDKLEQSRLEKSRAVLFNFLKNSNNECSNSDDSITQSKTLEDSFEITIVPDSLLTSFDPTKFDNSIACQNEDHENLYLNCLLNGKRKPFCSKSKINDSEIIEDLPEEYRNCKYIYLKFHENVKPPYFGPKLVSSLINGRNPFVKIPSLDYELDSDEEWEEGGPGESLSSSDSEPEEKDDYEIDNEFFVPHGYLSENEEYQEDDSDNNLKKNNRPLLKEQTLLAERSRRFNDKLIPEVIGCIWSTNKHLFRDKYEFLEQFQAVIVPK